jgi:DNA-binding XRE family transcriptional regulator
MNISQMKLAELADCSLQAIGNIERGNANPSLIMVYKLAHALAVSPRDLIP